MTNNQRMKSYLQKLVFAPLAEKGFTGKHPHYRRECENCIELISVQINKYGGSFTIEVSAVFPNNEYKNYVFWDEQICVWNTNQRYRLKGMYDGWFYYRDLYSKYALGFGKIYHDVSEKQADNFVAPKGYKLVQKFDDETATKICEEINKQLIKAFKWLERFKKKNL